MTPENATSIAVSGLQYLAGDETQLGRFIALTGITPDLIREMASQTNFQVAVLDFFLGDEPSLLSFAASQNIEPGDIQKARFALNPVDTDFM